MGDHWDQIAVDTFVSYLRIKTVQPNPDYESCTVFLEKVATDIGLKCQVVEMCQGKPIVIMTLEGSDGSLPSLLLNSHTDVVPVSEELWSSDPFAAIITDEGKIVARGAQDMKCVGVGYLEALRRLLNAKWQPKRSIVLTFVPDEEIGGHDGMEKLIQTDLFKGFNIGLALDEGIPSPFPSYFVFNQERVPWWISIDVKGVAGHGSGLPQGSASEKLFRIMKKIYAFRDEQIQRLAKSEGRLGEVTSVNITKLKAGIQTNVIPDTASMTIDVRISPSLGTDGFQEILADWTAEEGVSYSFEQKNPMTDHSSVQDDDPYWKSIKKTFDSFSYKFSVETFPGATDSRYLRQLGIPAYGISPFNNTPILLHDHDEFLDKQTFLDGIKLYEALIKELCQ